MSEIEELKKPGGYLFITGISITMTTGGGVVATTLKGPYAKA
jgi:hypothetical protein